MGDAAGEGRADQAAEGSRLDQRLANLDPGTAVAGRGADVVIQAANTAAILEGLVLVRPGGRYLSIGGGGGDITIPAAILSGKFLQFIGVRAAEGRHFYQALDFLATRKDVPFGRLITGEYTLSQTTEALQAMAELREVKPVIFPDRA